MLLGNFPVRGQWLAVVSVLLASLFAVPAYSQTYTHSVLIDSDNDAATGCMVSSAAGSVSGVEVRLDADVSGLPPQVTAVSRSECVGGSSFGPPVAQGGGYPVALNGGVGGADAIELAMVFADVPTPGPTWRIAMLSESDSGADLLQPFIATGFGNAPMPPPTVAPELIPSLSPGGLIGLSVAMAVLLLWGARRHRGLLSVVMLCGSLTFFGVAWAANFIADGNLGDWTGEPVNASDPTGDATSGEMPIDIVAGFARREGGNLFFRIDVNDAESTNRTPVIADQGFSLDEDAVNGAAVGTVVASDPDAGDTLAYAITAGNGAGVFAINAGSGAISVVDSSTLDFETTASYALTVSVTDDGTPVASSSATVTINVNDINEAPIAASDNYNTAEDTALNVPAPGVLGNDSDPDGDSLTAVLDTDVANGTLILNADGSFGYTPNLDFNGGDSFSYHANDGLADSNVVTVTITVGAENDPPTAVDDAFATDEDSTLNVPAVGVLANDTDPESDPLTVTAFDASSAQGASVAVNADGSFSYDPTVAAALQALASGDSVGDTFSYTVSDGTSTDVATVTVTVNGVDDLPTAVADAATVAEDAAATSIDVIANDSDPDGGPISINAVTQPGNGTVVITNAGADLTYQPNPGFCNDGSPTDDFTYTLTPGSSSTTVAVTVSCFDDPPVAVDDAATLAEDDPATAIDVLANDTDVDGGTRLVLSTTQPANGTVVIAGGGTGLTYAPAANYCNDPPGTTPDTFTYTLTPGGATATVSVTVSCVDDPPLAVADAATLAEDDPATAINVLANDSDVDGGPISINSVTQPANGTVVITGGGTGLTYQPNADTCNDGVPTDDFTYTLTPGGSTTTVAITVTCVDDPPLAVDDAASVGESDPATPIAVLANDTDIDGGAISIASVTQPANGSVVITGGGSGLTYQPTAGVCNDGSPTDDFTYSLAPGGSTATVAMTVTCVDDPPVAVADATSLNEDDPATAIDVLANDTDTDGGPISIVSVTQPANGTVVITGGGSGLTYQPDADSCNDGSPTDDFSYTLSPGGSTATVAVTVTCVDDEPVAVNDSATLTEDDPATPITVLGNDTDADGGAISIASVTQPTNGAVVITGGGTGLTYQPGPDYCNTPPGTTPDTFTYTLSPGGSVGTVSVSVSCVDDDPVAVADAVTVLEDSGATAINVLANDTDPDGGPISITGITQPANGAVVITGGGTGLTYQPNAETCNNGSPTDDFTYTLTPGGSSTTVAVTVTCVDDPPVAVDDAATVNEDSGATAINVLANDTDPDGGPISIGSVTQSANGTVVITGGGTGLTYQPNPNYCNSPPGTTPDSFTYTLSPGGSVGTVSMTVTCVNDPPVAGADSFDAIGNTELRVDLGAVATPHVIATTGSGSGVLDNDSDPVEADAVSVSGIVGCGDATAPFDCATVNGGTVSMQANGQFSYVSAPGDAAATDSFQYVLSDNGVPAPASSSGTVTITRQQRVWYVRNNAAAAGLGRSSDPFDTLLEAQTASAASDTIFVHTGDGTSTGQNAGITLKAGQRLLGQGVALSIPVSVNGNPSPTVLVTAGTRPLVGDATAGGPEGVSAVDVIPAEIAGLSLSGNVNAIEWTTSGAFAGTGALDIHDNVVSGAGAIGVDVNLAGTGATRLSFHDNALTATGTALNIQETGSGALTISAFDDNVVGGSTGGSGIVVNNAIFDATPGGAFNQVSGGVTTVGVSGDGVGATAMSLSGVAGDLAFTDLDLFGASGLVLAGTGAVNTGAGTGTRVTVGAGVATFNASAGPAVSASNATIDLQLAAMTSAGSASTGVSLSGIADGTSNATFSAPSGSSIASASGTAFNIDGGNATISYAGTINNTAGRSVAVQNRSADTATFSGGITDAGTGILLNANTGSTINFLGGVALTTGANAAFTATGGGTVNVCDDNPCNPAATGALVNTLTTTTATALNVSSTTIGANNLEFRSISSNGGAASGIVLNTTGSSGGLKVKGSGGAGSGGTITAKTGDGVSLISTSHVELTSLNVTNSGEDGIDGSTVNNFALTGCNVTGNGNAANEEGISLVNVSGVVGLSNVTATGNGYNNLRIDNTAGTVSSLNISGGSYSSNSAVTGNHGMLMEFHGTSQVTTATVDNVTVADNFSIGIQLVTGDTANVTATISNSSFSGTLSSLSAGSQEIGVDCSKAQMSNLTCAIDGNTFLFHNSHGLNIFSAAGAGTGGVLRATISNNVIGSAAQPGSGSNIGNGIRVNLNGDSNNRVLITGNTVREAPVGRGIEVIGRNGSGGSDVTVTSNNVNHVNLGYNPGTSDFPLAAIMLQSNCATVCNTLRSDVRLNTVPAGSSFDFTTGYISLTESSTSTLELIDSAPVSANCVAQLTSSNTGSAGASAGCALIPGPINTP